MVQKVRMNLENDSNYTRWMWLIPTARNSSPFYRRWWRWLGWYALNKDKLSHHSVMWTIEEWWYLKKKRIKPMWSMDHTQRSRRSIIQFDLMIILDWFLFSFSRDWKPDFSFVIHCQQQRFFPLVLLLEEWIWYLYRTETSFAPSSLDNRHRFQFSKHVRCTTSYLIH